MGGEGGNTNIKRNSLLRGKAARCSPPLCGEGGARGNNFAKRRDNVVRRAAQKKNTLAGCLPYRRRLDPPPHPAGRARPAAGGGSHGVHAGPLLERAAALVQRPALHEAFEAKPTHSFSFFFFSSQVAFGDALCMSCWRAGLESHTRRPSKVPPCVGAAVLLGCGRRWLVGALENGLAVCFSCAKRGDVLMMLDRRIIASHRDFGDEKKKRKSAPD